MYLPIVLYLLQSYYINIYIYIRIHITNVYIYIYVPICVQGVPNGLFPVRVRQGIR